MQRRCGGWHATPWSRCFVFVYIELEKTPTIWNCYASCDVSADIVSRHYVSDAIELDPRSERIVWEYRAPDPESFYTASHGAAQRLPNGNTLITESTKGHAFEVMPDGEIVWEYYSPHLNDRERRATITRLYRYDADMVEGLLEGH